MNGLLIVDKPAGMTSHDVVARVRHVARERSIGHLGTLDPMATGVLPLALGKFTRLAQFYGNAPKSYDGTIRFGFATDTYDADGTAVPNSPDAIAPESLTLDLLRAKAAELTGTIQQMPPPYSAKKVDGVRAYKLARNNKAVDLQLVECEVREFEIVDLQDSIAAFRVDVSAGTYVRSLAHDLGVKVSTGAHLATLRRTKVGEFDISEAISLDQLDRLAQSGGIESALLHPRRVLDFMPAVTATEQQVAYIRNGRSLNLLETSTEPLVRVYAGQRELVAVCRRIAGTLFQPHVVLISASNAE